MASERPSDVPEATSSMLQLAEQAQLRQTSKPITIQPPKTVLGIAAASLSASVRSSMLNPTMNSTRMQKKIADVSIAESSTRNSPKVVADLPHELDVSQPLVSENTISKNSRDQDSNSETSSHISEMSADELYEYSRNALHQADEDDEWQVAASEKTEPRTGGTDSDILRRANSNEFTTNNEELSTICLFCEETLPTPDLTVKHCLQKHNVNLEVCCHSLDELEYIRLINYIRKEQVSPELLSDGKICMPKAAWNQDAYLMPVISDDPLLTILITGNQNATDFEIPTRSGLNFEKDAEPPFDMLPDVLSRDLPELLPVNGERFSGQSLLLANDSTENLYTAKHADAASDDVVKFPDSNRSHDAGYFATYSHFGIHEEMLKDEIRTRGFLNAITACRDPYINNRTVLDVGCGTCILSAFAVRAGAARKVYAVDQADIVNDAYDILNENGGDVANRIEVIRSTIEQVHLSTAHVDVIISEWMGYFLLFESMLDSVLHARDRFLLKNSSRQANALPVLMIPNRATLYMSLISDEQHYAEAIEYWDDVYGLKMSRIKRLRLKTPEVGVVLPEACVSTSRTGDGVVLKQFDLMVMKAEETEFESYIRLPVNKKEENRVGGKAVIEKQQESDAVVEVTGLAGWFDVSVVLPGADEAAATRIDPACATHGEVLRMFTTSPFAPETHWKQTMFHLPQKMSLPIASTVVGRIRVAKHAKDKRALVIRITLWLDDVEDTTLPPLMNAVETNRKVVDSQKFLTRKPLADLTYEML